MARKKKNQLKMPAIIVGFLLILVGFVFSLMSLSDPVNNHSPLVHQEDEDMTKQEFIDRLRPHAEELQEGYGILPSIIISQAALESNWGRSQLAHEYNNLFGIKAYGNQDKVNLETKEYVNEQWITIEGDFRVYHSWEDSMDDHTMLFVNGVDWNPQKYEDVLTAQSHQEAAEALQEDGYATDPGYADKVIEVIENYQLDQYD
ncbi:glycoside hydrolase family 73 protein [Tetragenococcus halophilus]|uniref:Glycoside hydrolase family 73 protein n=1 Tax=Tetragenococcus halophilus TaxID=51669 RepID=A0AB35HNL9_TETHA|nr:glycoside hydrolase family 73 protein [Tetragenococcus halophilus]AOF48947.1 N-acetylmuramoyl-L-alanine amidase [Tetragenococcus halophilus]MCO8284045.1 glycoside hydrolase family 73 protein [Tetragenococcus halophilus]MCO8292436.1 glycoside hydrolase family 73 protein [Tetragenococcus halophilus]MCO8297781.1 glycoside hydrolase family 73 protein [Tetragenococcus halophilus]GBD65594.1 glucosaminidase [Tetragenococcus halophilus subsp. halophilus]